MRSQRTNQVTQKKVPSPNPRNATPRIRPTKTTPTKVNETKPLVETKHTTDVIKPAVGSDVKPVTESTTKRATEPVIPIAESIAALIMEPTMDTKTETLPTTELTTSLTTELITEPIMAPIMDTKTTPVIETKTKTVTEHATEHTTRVAAEVTKETPKEHAKEITKEITKEVGESGEKSAVDDKISGLVSIDAIFENVKKEFAEEEESIAKRMHVLANNLPSIKKEYEAGTISLDKAKSMVVELAEKPKMIVGIIIQNPDGLISTSAASEISLLDEILRGKSSNILPTLMFITGEEVSVKNVAINISGFAVKVLLKNTLTPNIKEVVAAIIECANSPTPLAINSEFYSIVNNHACSEIVKKFVEFSYSVEFSGSEQKTKGYSVFDPIYTRESPTVLRLTPNHSFHRRLLSLGITTEWRGRASGSMYGEIKKNVTFSSDTKS